MPQVHGFTHVSLSVRDLEASVTWYRDVLQLDVLVPAFEREGVYRETLLSVATIVRALMLLGLAI
jgi:catechol 2,3-dioxygenase-like lactoylglutathione lyase family enzyme